MSKLMIVAIIVLLEQLDKKFKKCKKVCSECEKRIQKCQRKAHLKLESWACEDKVNLECSAKTKRMNCPTKEMNLSNVFGMALERAGMVNEVGTYKSFWLAGASW